MFFKIQPEQIQLHTFSSPSGDIKFDIGSNYVYANLSRALTGNFAITGALTVNGYQIPTIAASNLTSGPNNFTWGGISNTNTGGQNNVVLNGTLNVIAGTGNTVLNGRSTSFSPFTNENTLLAGESAIFRSGTDGATILKDFGAYSTNDNGSDTLTIAFQSGTFFENGKIVLKDTDFYLSSFGSGVISGGLFLFGDAQKNGVTLATTGDLAATSGYLTGRDYTISGLLSTRIDNTGSNLDSRLILTGSGLSSSINLLSANNPVFRTGDQTISGVKTFHQNTVFSQSIYLSGGSGILSGISGRTQTVPTGSGDSAGGRGLVSFSGAFLYYKISDNPHIWARHSGQLNWP